MQKVSVAKFAEHMRLECLTPGIDITERYITKSEVNRPALELTGFYEGFASERIQVIGKVESAYMELLPKEISMLRFQQLMEHDIPCLVLCRGYQLQKKGFELAIQRGIPVLGTRRSTSDFLSEAIHYLSGELAPSISIHGVLVDVYGEGILIMGESGIGKSEAALELVKRGHRLVTDDVVEIRRLSNNSLVGRAPAITQYFIELRGIGIIDVKTLFGVEAVKEKQTIDLVIKLENWEKEHEYDRLGLEEEYTEILGTQVVCHSIPIRPGRNLAIICEAAAVNHRQKKMGYNAAQELYRRVEKNLKESREAETWQQNE
ncbi:MAG: HPr(Ser) kinase/phosphatase [Lachnospiraceae bacterium]|nr:HPr(Ser) kinase/phosphatase [Lachnospiraceae bacterium]